MERAQARDRGATTTQCIPTPFGPAHRDTEREMQDWQGEDNERKTAGEEMDGGREDMKWKEEN